ncbi:MAG: hypothetical protein GY786_13330 [Proteobacteria bacterium]|nr:hypothetical protein [Pseudomonadota bacterium]
MPANINAPLNQGKKPRTAPLPQSPVKQLTHFSDFNRLHEVPIEGIGSFYISKTDMAFVPEKGDYVSIDEKNFHVIANIFAA